MFVMTSHYYCKYISLVIVLLDIAYGVDKPKCDFTSMFIEPSGRANLPLTKEWFIWGQLFSYCLQVS